MIAKDSGATEIAVTTKKQTDDDNSQLRTTRIKTDFQQKLAKVKKKKQNKTKRKLRGPPVERTEVVVFDGPILFCAVSDFDTAAALHVTHSERQDATDWKKAVAIMASNQFLQYLQVPQTFSR